MKKSEKIVEQLADVFRKYGYHGTTLSIISQETGLGRSSIYHHFPEGKDAMALAAIDYVEKRFARCHGALINQIREQNYLLFSALKCTPICRTAPLILIQCPYWPYRLFFG